MATRTQTRHEEREYTFHDIPLTPAETIRTTLLNRVAWGAVWAGVALTFAAHLILNMLGIGIGLAMLDTQPGVSAYEFSWGGAVWWTVAGIIAAYIGGFTAGRLTGEPKLSTSAWHGLVTWAMSLLVMVILLSGAAGALGNLGGPFQIVLDHGTITSSQMTAETGGTPYASPGYAPQTPYTTGTPAETMPAVPADTLAMAALISAIALLIGAFAAWMGGRAGTVNKVDVKEDVTVTTH